MEMLNNAMSYFSPPSTPRKSVMQFFENLNPLNSFKADGDHHQMAQNGENVNDKSSPDTKSLKSHLPPKHPLSSKSAAAAFNFSNNSISNASVYPTSMSPAAIVLEKPPKGRASRPLSMIIGKKKPPPPPPCDPSTSATESEYHQELDPEVLAGALAKTGLIVEEDEEEKPKIIVEEKKESDAEIEALFPPRPPKPGHLSRTSSMKPLTLEPTPTSDSPPPIPPKTYKKNFGASS